MLCMRKFNKSIYYVYICILYIYHILMRLCHFSAVTVLPSLCMTGQAMSSWRQALIKNIMEVHIKKNRSSSYSVYILTKQIMEICITKLNSKHAGQSRSIKYFQKHFLPLICLHVYSFNLFNPSNLSNFLPDKISITIGLQQMHRLQLLQNLSPSTLWSHNR